MRKFAFIIKLFQDTDFHGGGEKIFYKLITKLIENNFSIDIYCSKTNVIQYPGINNIIVVKKPYLHENPSALEDFYEETKNLLLNKSYDFIISENITPPIDITFIQGHSVTYRKHKLKNFLEAFFYNFRKVKFNRIKYENIWLKHGYRKIFVLSNILKQDIINNFNIPEDQVKVIYPGVDSLPASINNNPMKEPKDFVFGLSAPGFKRKGGYVFLKALKLLKNKGFDFKAKIIYPKFRRNIWIKFLVKIYGIEKNIEFIDFQKNMQHFYTSIDCLVMPSIEESFGLVALEAMINKKLALVSSFSGASEILTDGEDGFIFNMKKNPSENLADKMAFILNNLDKYKKYTRNGYYTANIYSWDRTYNEFINELSVFSPQQKRKELQFERISVI